MVIIHGHGIIYAGYDKTLRKPLGMGTYVIVIMLIAYSEFLEIGFVRFIISCFKIVSVYEEEDILSNL